MWMSLLMLMLMNKSSYVNGTCDSNGHVPLVAISILALEIVVKFIVVTESVISEVIP